MPFSGGTGIPEDPYQVASVADLLLVEDYLSKHFIQVADIDCTTAGNLTFGLIGLKSLSGSYDGQGYELYNITAIPQGVFGLFLTLDSTAVVRRVTMRGTLTGGSSGIAAGIVWHMIGNAVVQDCLCQLNSTTACQVVGIAYPTYDNVLRQCLCLSTTNAEVYGGINGNEPNFAPPYGVPVVTQNCYYDKTLMPNSTTGTGTGLTTAQLKSGVLPEGFDPDIWKAVAGEYPELRRPPNLLTISSAQGGTVLVPGEGEYPYEGGTVVNVTAKAVAGYQFAAWTGTAADEGKVASVTSASTTVTLDDDYTLIATFEEAQASDAITLIDAAIYEILSNDSGVHGCTEGRIYVNYIPQGKGYPAVTWQNITTTRDYSADGATGLVDATFQIDCWAPTHREVRQLAAAVRHALSAYRGIAAEVTIQSIFITDEGDSSEYPAEQEMKRAYGKRFEIQIWYEE